MLVTADHGNIEMMKDPETARAAHGAHHTRCPDHRGERQRRN